MEGIVLAGGFGTRLRTVVADVPKPMAPVAGRPFLTYILDDLVSKGFSHVVLAVGYKHEIIEQYFGSQYKNLQLDYSVERIPLGTGGAIRQALRLCSDTYVMVFNGDTFFEVDLPAMYEQAVQKKSVLTMAVRAMRNFSRYGHLLIEAGTIKSFAEKEFCRQGFINGGVYCLRHDAIDKIEQPVFSFERDFAEKYCQQIAIQAFFSDGYFIDIGIPEDYARAQEDFVGRASKD